MTGPGSSGSPLLDRWGRLLGIILCQESEMPQINFAIPVDTVTRIVTQIVRDGRTAQPFIGVTILGAKFQEQLERENGVMYDGAVIMYIVPKSPAAEAGLVGLAGLSDGKHKVGHMIVGADGKRVQKKGDFYSVLDAKEPGDIIQLTVSHADDWSQHILISVNVACADNTAKLEMELKDTISPRHPFLK